MIGIDLNKHIEFTHGSMRYFDAGERYVTRLCPDNVLLMVFKGILRFVEDGIQYEIKPGEYFIQKDNSYQEGSLPCDSPEYFYVHFTSSWLPDNSEIPQRGNFDIEKFMPYMEELDALCHSESSHTLKTYRFLNLLLKLAQPKYKNPVVLQIVDYINNSFTQNISLDDLCNKFNFSKNHIIRLFNEDVGTTPVKYINSLRLNRANHLMESTAASLEAIAIDCGFNNYSHFYNLFYSKNKTSPTRYRKRFR